MTRQAPGITQPVYYDGACCQGPSCCLSVSRDAPSGLAAVKHPILVSDHEALRIEIHVSNGGKTLYPFLPVSRQNRITMSELDCT